MKKKMNRKLRLNKETVCNLSERAMRNLRGGATWTVGCEDTFDCLTEGGLSICIGVCPSINVPCESQQVPCGVPSQVVP